MGSLSSRVSSFGSCLSSQPAALTACQQGVQMEGVPRTTPAPC